MYTVHVVEPDVAGNIFNVEYFFSLAEEWG